MITSFKNQIIRRAITLFMVVFLLSAAQTPAHAEFGFSGMQIQGMTASVAEALALPKPEGIMVRDVSLGGPADMAGIKRGDLILEVNGQKIRTFKQMVKVVMATKPAQTLDVRLQRQGKTQDVKLLLGKRPPSWSVTKGEVSAMTKIGITLAAITEKIRSRFDIRWGSVGVLVTLVEPEFADIMKLVRGDVIVQIDQQDVWMPSQIVEKYNAAKQQKRSHLLMLVERTSGFTFMMLPVK